jgi:NADP oxidoreductase coenzyme F420-dependent
MEITSKPFATKKNEEANMKIGFIGAGHIGGNLARLAAKAGHEVLVSNSRNPKTLFTLLEQIGDKAKGGSQRCGAFWRYCRYRRSFLRSIAWWSPLYFCSRRSRRRGTLAAMPAYARVKQQLPAATCAELRLIVQRDDEPLHRKWV